MGWRHGPSTFRCLVAGFYDSRVMGKLIGTLHCQSFSCTWTFIFLLQMSTFQSWDPSYSIKKQVPLCLVFCFTRKKYLISFFFFFPPKNSHCSFWLFTFDIRILTILTLFLFWEMKRMANSTSCEYLSLKWSNYKLPTTASKLRWQNTLITHPAIL